MTAKRTNHHVTLNIFSWKNNALYILYEPTYIFLQENTENCLDNAMTNHILLAQLLTGALPLLPYYGKTAHYENVGKLDMSTRIKMQFSRHLFFQPALFIKIVSNCFLCFITWNGTQLLKINTCTRECINISMQACNYNICR